ncbi:MAG TPA: CDP-glycerol glycerophosphotransferase family protein [Lacisediminihabitans sp.]|uniref:CDP-glycerol glycerophosphotransferase family protein n=1 Tax=Lacisediminihabitans sp. TaxID=2787631 RepID=UPI002ED7DE9C
MPSFNFARGNAKKLLSLPLYAMGSFASLMVPRSDRQWVFGSGGGVGEGSLAVLSVARGGDPSLRITWMARNPDDLERARALGLRAVLATSARGFWATLRARVAVVTHGFGDVNRYGTRGAFVAQLWHGIPLKLIQLDSPVTMRSGILSRSRLLRGQLRWFYRRGYRRGITLMPASSELVAARLRSAFGLPSDRVVVTGDPRDDVLCRGTAETRRDAAKALLAERLPSAGESRVVLFAPTWRDGAVDPGVPSERDWSRLDSWLRATDTFLVIRPHPLGIGDYLAGPARSDRIALLTPAAQRDINPVLPAVDALITDYSSIAFDYSLTAGPIFFLAPDEEEYTASRGLYEPYREFSGARQVRSWPALVSQLERYDSDETWAEAVRQHTVSLRDRHFEFLDGHNAERVYEQITRRLKARQ